MSFIYSIPIYSNANKQVWSILRHKHTHAQMLLSRPRPLDLRVFESWLGPNKGMFLVNTKKFIYHYMQNEINSFYQMGPTKPIRDSKNTEYHEKTPKIHFIIGIHSTKDEHPLWLKKKKKKKTEGKITFTRWGFDNEVNSLSS